MPGHVCRGKAGIGANAEGFRKVVTEDHQRTVALQLGDHTIGIGQEDQDLLVVKQSCTHATCGEMTPVVHRLVGLAGGQTGQKRQECLLFVAVDPNPPAVQRVE